MGPLSFNKGGSLLHDHLVHFYMTIDGAETLKRFLKISPIAWSHISFTGKYNFKKSDGQVDFEKLIVTLEMKIKSFGVV